MPTIRENLTLGKLRDMALAAIVGMTRTCSFRYSSSSDVVIANSGSGKCTKYNHFCYQRSYCIPVLRLFPQKPHAATYPALGDTDDCGNIGSIWLRSIFCWCQSCFVELLDALRSSSTSSKVWVAGCIGRIKIRDVVDLV